MGALTKVRLKSATGVSLADDRIVATTVALTPFGLREVDSVEIPVPEEGYSEAIRMLVEQGNLRGQVVIGVDPRDASFLTRLVPPGEEVNERAKLKEQVAAWAKAGLVMGWAFFKSTSGTYVSTVKCEHKLASEIYEGLKELHSSQLQLEAAALAVYRLAVLEDASPKRWRTVIRVFPGESGYLAVLSQAAGPLAQRLFDCPAGNSIRGIEIATRALRVHAATRLGISKVDGILFQTGKEGAELATECEDSIGLPCRAVSRIVLDQETKARALAMTSLRPSAISMNLLDTLRPPPGMKENFPTAVAVLLAVIVFACFWLLRGEAVALEGRVEQLQTQAKRDAKSAGSKVSAVGLKFEGLAKDVETAHAFIDQRVFWPQVFDEVNRCVPEGVVLTVFKGHDTIALRRRLTKQEARKAKKMLTKKKGGKAKFQKDLVLTGAVRMKPGQQNVPEIIELLQALRSSKLLQKEFPHIGGAELNLKEFRAEGGSAVVAQFSIKCEF